MYIYYTRYAGLLSRTKMIIHNSASGRGEESNWKDHHLVWTHNGWLNSQPDCLGYSWMLKPYTHEGADVSYYLNIQQNEQLCLIVWSFVGLDMSNRLTRIQTHIQTRVHGHVVEVVRVQETRERTCACWTPRWTSWTMPPVCFRPVGTTGTMSKKIFE